VADELLSHLIKLPDVYYRFNVNHGVEQVRLDEWEGIGDVLTHTRAYLLDPQVSRSIDSVVEHLCEHPVQKQQVTLAALSGHVKITPSQALPNLNSSQPRVGHPTDTDEARGKTGTPCLRPQQQGDPDIHSLQASGNIGITTIGGDQNNVDSSYHTTNVNSGNTTTTQVTNIYYYASSGLEQ